MKQRASFCLESLVWGIVVTLIVTMSLSGKPTRPNDAKPKEANPVAIPNLDQWETQFGTITQQGRDLHIDGHRVWYGDGVIGLDGMVSFTWQRRDDETLRPARYKIVGNKLVGHYGLMENVTIQEDGSLTGSLTEETLIAKEEEPL